MSCTLPSLPSSVPSFCVDGFFVIVIVNVVGSRTITAIETDDVVRTKADEERIERWPRERGVVGI